MPDLKTRILKKLALFTGKNFSLDRHFKKKKAVAMIRFTKETKLGGSIILSIGGMNYYFEGVQEISEYKNAAGGMVVQKRVKYGGWEMDLTHEDNKLPVINPQKKVKKK